MKPELIAANKVTFERFNINDKLIIYYKNDSLDDPKPEFCHITGFAYDVNYRLILRVLPVIPNYSNTYEVRIDPNDENLFIERLK